MTRLALTFVLGLGLGLALGFAFSSRPGALDNTTQPPSSLAPATDASPPERFSPSSIELEVEAPSRTAREQEASPERSAAVPTRNGGANGSATAEERAIGQIRGRIRTPDGIGVGGVLVRASGDSRASPFTAPSEVGSGLDVDSLDHALKEVTERYRRRQRATYETTSGTDGSFAFSALPQDDYELRVLKKGYEIARSGNRSPFAYTNTEVDFIARRILELPVKVRRPDGSIANEAVIEASFGESDLADLTALWTPDRPTLRLPEGTVELVAHDFTKETYRRTRDASAVSRVVRVELAANAPLGEVELLLVRRLGIRGTVAFAANALTDSRARVFVALLSPGEAPDLEKLEKTGKSVRINRESRYSFADLAPGRYLVGVSRNGSSPIEAHTVVEVVDQFVEADLELPPLDPSRYLSVRVVTADGAPLDDVAFRLERMFDERRYTRNLPPFAGGEGLHYVAVPLEFRRAYFEESDSVFWLRAHTDQYGSTSLRLQPGQISIEVELSRPARLEIQVETTRLELLTRMHVFVERVGGPDDGQRLAQGNIGTDATLLTPAFKTGDVRISLLLVRQGTPGSNPIVVRELSVGPGTQRVALELPPLHELQVLVPDVEDSVSVELQRTDSSVTSWMKTSTVDRRATFTELVAGSYLATTVVDGERRQMEFTVPSGPIELGPED